MYTVKVLSPIYRISHCIQFSAACHTQACQQAHMHTHASAQPDQGRSKDLGDHQDATYLTHTHTPRHSHNGGPPKYEQVGGLYQMAALLFHCYAQRNTYTHPYLHTQMHPQTHVCSVGAQIHRQTHTHTHTHTHFYNQILWYFNTESFKLTMFDLTIFNTVPTVCVTLLFVIKCRGASQ